jgi:chromosome segregation ATPase
MLAELLVLIYTSSMLFKHSLQILFVTTLITIPLTASVKQKNESSIDFDFSYTTQINDNQNNIYEVKRSKDNTDETEKKLSKRQKELMKKREKALAEIEARKAEAERLEQVALEEQARLEKEAKEKKEAERKACEEEVNKAFEALTEARGAYHAALDKYCEKFGTYKHEIKVDNEYSPLTDLFDTLFRF